MMPEWPDTTRPHEIVQSIAITRRISMYYLMNWHLRPAAAPQIRLYHTFIPRGSLSALYTTLPFNPLTYQIGKQS
jgi:hypothetical protein